MVPEDGSHWPWWSPDFHLMPPAGYSFDLYSEMQTFARSIQDSPTSAMNWLALVVLGKIFKQLMDWIAMKVAADIHTPLRMNSNNSDDSLKLSFILNFSLWLITWLSHKSQLYFKDQLPNVSMLTH